jgi:hypothetical protein
MNLVDVDKAPPARVLAKVRERAAALGLDVGADEVVGLCPARCAPPAAAGRVLEAREGAAVARAAGEPAIADRLVATAADSAALREAAALIAKVACDEAQLVAVRDHALTALTQQS